MLISHRILIIFSILHVSTSFELECEFHEWVGWGYGCLVTKGTIRDRAEATVTSISGEHLEENEAANVIWISIESQVMKYFPKNIGTFFSNLTTIYLAKSQVREIQADDFVSLENLKNLFLDNNEIAKVDVKAFEILPKLRSLSFDYNKCHSDSVYYNRTAVLTLIGEIKTKCYTEIENSSSDVENATTITSNDDDDDDDSNNDDDEEIDVEMKIARLEEQVKEIAKMRRTLASYEQQIVDLSAKNERLRENEGQLFDLQKENQVIKKELSLRNREIANLKAENANLGSRVTRCDTNNGQQRIQIKDLKSESENLKTKMLKLEKEIEEMNTLREKLTTCNENSEDLEQKIEHLSIKITDLTSSADTQNDEMLMNLVQISTLEDLIKSLKIENEKCHADKSDHLTNVESIQKDMVSCEERMLNKQAEIKDLKEDLKKLDNLQVELKNCKTGISNYDKQLIKLINDNANLKANVTQCSLNNCDEEVASLLSEIDSLSKISQNCEDEKSAMLEENEELMGKISTLKNSNENLHVEISSISTKNENLLASLQSEISQHLSSSENLRLELTTLNREILTVKAENQELIAQSIDCNNLRFQLGNLKAENSHIRALITRCESEVMACEALRDSTSNICDEKASEIENLRHSIALNDATISAMLIDGESLKARIAICDQQVASAFADNDILRSSLSMCDSEVTRCDSKLTRIAMENENLKASLNNFEIQLTGLMGENQRLAQTAISSSDLDNIRASLSASHEAQILIANLSNENENLTNLLGRCEAEIFNLNDDVHLLENFQQQLKDYVIQTEDVLEKCRTNNAWCFNTYCGRVNTWNH